MRRAFTKVQNRSTFPAWPVEDGLHDLYQWLFALVAELAGQPVPYLNLWPEGRSWAMVLTHDPQPCPVNPQGNRWRSTNR